MPRDIAEKLRAAIRRCGKSANQLAKASGVEQSTISRFLQGKDMGIHRAAKLAACLGLVLREK
jgi:transcriptional regulator with XRE-family HTH domain